MKNIAKFINKLGPGMLYAAAAIGVSHLVQSTRAGAEFGLFFLLIILITHIIKYPFLQAGPRYTAITGDTILRGYKNIHISAVYLVGILTLLTMFSIQAAVTLVTAGIVKSVFQLNFSTSLIALVLLILAGSILIFGRYHLLDKFIKIIIVILTITTLFACLSAYQIPKPSQLMLTSFDFSDSSHLLFLFAFMGWMPAPMDISIWQSIWTKAKSDERQTPVTLKNSLFDFNIGFIGTAIVASLFLILGERLMYGTGMSFSSDAASFASQLISLYTQILGKAAYPIIALAALTTMFSTTLTCLDAFPRVMREISYEMGFKLERKYLVYNFWIIVTILGSLIILNYFTHSMKAMVDFATTLSFLTAPFIASLNILVINSNDIPQEYQTNKYFKYYSLISLLILLCLSIYFFFI